MIKYYLVPGFNGSDEYQWQTFWARSLINAKIIAQDNWGEGAVRDDWTKKIENELQAEDFSKIVLIGHSLGVATIIHWAKSFGHKIRGALLVAPTNVDELAKPISISGFSPMPMEKLPFPSIIVASTNDDWVSIEKAAEYCKAWGSKMEVIGPMGHINSDSRLGEWPRGREILATL